MNREEVKFLQGRMEKIAEYLRDIDNRTRRIEQVILSSGIHDGSGSVKETFKDILSEPKQKEGPVIVKPDPKAQLERARKRLERMKGMEKPVKKKKSFPEYLWWRIIGRK